MVGRGAVTGAVAGLALSLRGASFQGIGMLTIMGIVPALFRSIGRIPTAAVFSLTAAIMGLVFKDLTISLREISALGSALMLFLLLPKSIIYRVDFDKDGVEANALSAENLKKVANTRMNIFSDSFLKLSKTLDSITERQARVKQKEKDMIFEDISERLCKNCRNCSFCWDTHIKEAHKAACDMFDWLKRKGTLKAKIFPTIF